MKKILCVIDIQKEYSTCGRPFFIEDIELSLANAKLLLEFARKNKWDIIHVQHLQAGNIFSKSDIHAEFVKGFEPKSTELHIVKENFSCFSNLEFSSYLNKNKNSQIYVIGYGSTMCCLSTIIEGYHRGFKLTFVDDASGAKPTVKIPSKHLHDAATEIISTFAQVVKTDLILGEIYE